MIKILDLKLVALLESQNKKLCLQGTMFQIDVNKFL